MSAKHQEFENSSGIQGLQEIEDFFAEHYMGGDFRFAVSDIGQSDARTAAKS